MKSGPAVPLTREAKALEDLAGLPHVPELIEHTPGRIVTSRVPGAAQPAEQITPDMWRQLTRALATLHVERDLSEVRVPHLHGRWISVSRPEEIANARFEGAVAAAESVGVEDLRPEAPPPTPERVCRTHGDLVLENVLWHGHEVYVVDWEFSRVTDPAEDLAYLIIANCLNAEAIAAIRDGYPDPEVWSRVGAWIPIARADTASWWYRVGLADRAKVVHHHPVTVD